MRRKSTVLIATALCAAAFNTNAFAANVTEEGGTNSAEVKATYQAGDLSETIYSVDVSWGSMEFIYTDVSQGTWDPVSHDYKDIKEAAWSHADNANIITVTNHSNTGVDVYFKYDAGENYTGITGNFTNVENDTAILDTAVGTEVEAAPFVTVKLELSGVLSQETAEGSVIGEVTVTIGTETTE